MHIPSKFAMCCLLVLASAGALAQQKPATYPAQGQSDDKKAQDDGS